MIQFAFESLQLERVVATTRRTNVASVGVMRRLGMRIETNPYPDAAWFQICEISTWSGRQMLPTAPDRSAECP
jgi:hypothetical protein